MTLQEAEVHLQRTFRLKNFHEDQWKTIQRILNGEKVLLIEKTGFGKSLCYQFPATLFPGITVIFSPLIALMRDQVKKLDGLGINAKCINSEQSLEENNQIIQDARQGKVKILYIAPERQENSTWIEATQSLQLSMVVVDEAHCISVWGHDFRPAFRRIVNLVKLLPKNLPVLATTATATKRVETDIAAQMGDGIQIVRGNLMRDNLQLHVIKVSSEDEKLIWLGKHINDLEGSGILYTGTRVETEIYTKWFTFLGVSSTGYNAGLDTESRIEIEDGLMTNRWKCIISTNALGMGIDKSDIRFIIHTQIPQSPIHYYQEIGRAGRDGKISKVILFYGPDDRKLPEVFIEGGRPAINKYHKVIDALRFEMLGERDLVKRTNMKQTQIRVIKADLLEQKIIREVTYGSKKKFELIPNAPTLNMQTFDNLRQAKLQELDQMIGYVETKESRMQYLCNYLGDTAVKEFKNCDNTGLPRLKSELGEEWVKKLEEFRENYFPELEVANGCLINGVAASYYGVSNVGAAIHRSKYEGGGDFPDFLVSLALKAFRKKFGQEKFDLVTYVPPTSSGTLVKNFAVKIASTLKTPVSHGLVKNRETREQKVFQNAYLKKENLSGAFTYLNPLEVKGKKILLIDDIFDSGTTIKEIGQTLGRLGALIVAPIVIAKTVGGDV